jgi:hypothetical protein
MYNVEVLSNEELVQFLACEGIRRLVLATTSFVLLLETVSFVSLKLVSLKKGSIKKYYGEDE